MDNFIDEIYTEIKDFGDICVVEQLERSIEREVGIKLDQKRGWELLKSDTVICLLCCFIQVTFFMSGLIIYSKALKGTLTPPQVLFGIWKFLLL